MMKCDDAGIIILLFVYIYLLAESLSCIFRKVGTKVRMIRDSYE